MPSIDNYANKSTAKKFKKTAYRPWTVIEGTENSAPVVEESTVISSQQTFFSSTDEPKEQVGRFINAVPSQKSISKQLDNDSQTIDEQPINKNETIEYQSEISLPNVSQSVSDQFSKQNSVEFKAINNVFVANNWSLEESVYHLGRLFVLQRKLLLYVGTKCLARNDLCSGPISVRELSDLLGANVDTVKTTAQRLVNKGFIKRDKGKSGNGGFTIFHIQENTKKAILEDIQQTQLSPRLVNQHETNQETRKPSISSNYNTNTTQIAFEENLLPNEWETINTTPLAEIGFGKAHLMQIQKFGSLTSEQVQESISAFAFDLQVNGKGERLKGPPLNFFMGILRSGVPYAPSENYEAPETRALKAYLEKKKREQQQRETLEKEAFSFAFEDWAITLTEEQVSEIIPEPRFREPGSPFRRGGLELYFRNNIWSALLNEIKSAS